MKLCKMHIFFSYQSYLRPILRIKSPLCLHYITLHSDPKIFQLFRETGRIEGHIMNEVQISLKILCVIFIRFTISLNVLQRKKCLKVSWIRFIHLPPYLEIV